VIPSPRVLAGFLAACLEAASSVDAQEVEGRPIFDWDLVSLEQNSHRFNGSVLSGFHSLRSPGVTPHRAWKAGLGLLYSQEDQIASEGGQEHSFSTQRLIMNPKVNYGFFDSIEVGAGLEANYVEGKTVDAIPGLGTVRQSEDNADLSAAVVGVKWAFPPWWRQLRLGAAFDARIAVNRGEFGLLPETLFNVELDSEYVFTSRFSMVGNLQFMTSDDFHEISDQVIADLGATYTFSDRFRGMVFGTAQEDDPSNAATFFLGFAGQYLAGRHAVTVAVDFQINDVRRDVRTEGQIDLEVSYTFTFR